MRSRPNNHYPKFLLALLSVCLVFLFTTLPAAADDSLPVPSPTITPSDYKMPYPGLLPDSPLYFLKTLRDSVVGFFIGKPLDKADFMLLQSDKNVEASYMLVTQSNPKVDLAVKTFLQGQASFDEAIEQTELARKQGLNIDDMQKKLADANQEHFHVLDQIDLQVKDPSKFQKIRKQEQQFTQTVKTLRRRS